MPKATKKVQSDTALLEENEVSTRRYELMAILDPDVTEAQHTKNMEALKSLIEQEKGSIWHEEAWGKRELAYSIKRKINGFYVIFDFDGATQHVPELTKQLKIMPFVLRHLLIGLPLNYTPQKYDLEMTLERIEDRVAQRAEKEGKMSMKPKPRRALTRPTTPAQEKTKIVEAVESTPKKTVKAEPVMEPADSEQELKKLDKKLEELLSSDDDLNL